MVINEDSRLLPNREAYVSDFMKEEVMMFNVTTVTHNGELLATFAEFFESNSYLDVTFICANNLRIKGHKLVLSSVSPFLKELLENWNGPQNDIQISIPDISRSSMKHVLDFLYSGNMKLEWEEFHEFKDALRLLNIQLQNAIVKHTIPFNRPPPLALLDSREKRELSKKNRLPKVVETVSLNSASMFVPNATCAEEEGSEPIIDIDVCVQPECSSKTTSVDPEFDPLNVPDYYYVQPAVVEQPKIAPKVAQKESTPTTTTITAASGTTSAATTTTTTTRAITSTTTTLPSSSSSSVPSESSISKATNSNIRTRLPNKHKTSTDAPRVHSNKKKSPSDAERLHDNNKGPVHNLRTHHNNKTPAYREAEESPDEQDDDDPIGWLYKLKKEDLIEQLNQFELDTAGSVPILRARLSYYLQHELRAARDSPPPPAPSPASVPKPEREQSSRPPEKVDSSIKRPAVATSDLNGKTPAQKRKHPLGDISIKLKQPRVVIRDMADDVTLNERMRISGLKSLYRSPPKTSASVPQTSVLGSSATQSNTTGATQLLSMSPHRSNKHTRTPKDPNLWQLNLTDTGKQTHKTYSRRKQMLVETPDEPP